MFATPAYPLEEVFDPTGAGDSFAGGFMGQLARSGDLSQGGLRRAIVYGSVVASFTVEDFGVKRLTELSMPTVEERYRRFVELDRFPFLSRWSCLIVSSGLQRRGERRAADRRDSPCASRWRRNATRVIVVDDGSSGRHVCHAAAAIPTAIPLLHVIRLKRNFGQTAALAAGLAHASGEIVDPDGRRWSERSRRHSGAAGQARRGQRSGGGLAPRPQGPVFQPAFAVDDRQPSDIVGPPT